MADWKSSQEFLKEFYASPIVNEDTISAKIKRIFLPKSRKASALKELAGDLSGEGRAGDVILDRYRNLEKAGKTQAFCSYQSKSLSLACSDSPHNCCRILCYGCCRRWHSI